MLTALPYINTLACVVISIWATWCAFSTRVKHGLFGKSMYAIVSIASLCMVLAPSWNVVAIHSAEVTLHVAIAALGVRHVFMKYFWEKLQAMARDCFCAAEEKK